ncbi:MAG: NADH-quinone oxidoreductase subunit C [bacterium]
MAGHSVLEQLQAQFPTAIRRPRPDGDFLILSLSRDDLHPVVGFLKAAQGLNYALLMDVTAVDYLRYPAEIRPADLGTARFAVVYTLVSLEIPTRIRLRVPLEEADAVVDSLADLYGAANWLEREVWDMFGIRFRGHPNLTRILMYDQFEGHPLRKDYPLMKRQPLVPREEWLKPEVPPLNVGYTPELPAKRP